MKLKPFVYYHPAALKKAFQFVSAYEPNEYLFVGGGTDVLVRMRQKLIQPRVIIDLKTIQGLKDIKIQDNYMTIGSVATLEEVTNFSTSRNQLAALATACKRVAGPQVRNMGTIGGNVCLETRCSYYNQMVWPGGFEPCFKRGGTLCHVMRRGKSCYALFCGDTPPALMVLNAVLCLAGPNGSREIPVNDFYSNDGINHLNKEPQEIITKIKIPLNKKVKSTYARSSERQAIDFPDPGVAMAVDLEAGRIAREVYVAVTGLLSKPMRLKSIEDMLRGTDLRRINSQKLDDYLKKLKVIPHQGRSPWYKKHMLKVLIDRAIGDILPERSD